MENIGVDLLDLSEFPDYEKNQKDRFFKDNFSISELKYIKTKNNRTLELAKIFSLKESLVKAGVDIELNFNKIEITFIENTPYFKGYKVCVSSDTRSCLATAIKE